jgi:hypothetical protein
MPLEEEKPSPKPEEGRDWMCVYRARTLLEADLMAASLRAEGFHAEVDSPNTSAILDGALTFTLPGGVAVRVPAEQAEEVAAIVAEYENRRLHPPGPDELECGDDASLFNPETLPDEHNDR